MIDTSVVVHPGCLKPEQFTNNRNEILYGDYHIYLESLEKFVRNNDCIIITDPNIYRPNCVPEELVPFEVPESTRIIADRIETVDNVFKTYSGISELEKTLRSRNDVGICGERLWLDTNEVMSEDGYRILGLDWTVPGCVVKYMQAVQSIGHTPKLVREVCYPLKERPDKAGLDGISVRRQ